jgi:outer membrane protein OmpA-like peptidoglycan-associated protein
MKASITSKKEKRKGEPDTNSYQKAKPLVRSEKGGPAGLPAFLNKAAESSTVLSKVRVRPQLKTEASGNYEQEADRARESVQRTADQSTFTTPTHDGTGGISNIAEKDGGQSIASGARLPDATRGLMEEEFGADFGGVRVHSDARANGVADSFGANALTKGEDIYFNRDRYDPVSADGRGLLAHELAHVVQQRGNAAGQVQFDLMASLPVTQGYFEIEMATRTAPRAGMEGHLRFFPDPSGSYSAQIGLIQIANVTDVAGRTNPASGAPVDWSNVGAGGEAERNVTKTTGTDGAPAGWFVDTVMAGHPAGSAYGPNYLEPYGESVGHNEYGWLRSPTDLHQASLGDYPTANGEFDFEFETVAKATDTQNVYGVIEWGFQIRSGVVRNEYMRAFDTASATFSEALERFRGYFTHEPIVIYFDTDLDTPMAGEDAKITGVLDYLSRYPDVRVNIDGYADERGTVVHNHDLALRRADNVLGLAVSLGVDASRINFTVGHGETTAFAPGAPLDAGTWRANRRVVMSFERTASTPIVMP